MSEIDTLYDRITFLDRCTIFGGDCVAPYAIDDEGHEIDENGIRIHRLDWGDDVELYEEKPGFFLELEEGVAVGSMVFG